MTEGAGQVSRGQRAQRGCLARVPDPAALAPPYLHRRCPAGQPGASEHRERTLGIRTAGARQDSPGLASVSLAALVFAPKVQGRIAQGQRGRSERRPGFRIGKIDCTLKACGRRADEAARLQRATLA